MGGQGDRVARSWAAECPGAPHFARSGNNNNTAEGVTGDDGERASGERTVVEMATALKGGCRRLATAAPG